MVGAGEENWAIVVPSTTYNVLRSVFFGPYKPVTLGGDFHQSAFSSSNEHCEAQSMRYSSHELFEVYGGNRDSASLSVHYKLL